MKFLENGPNVDQYFLLVTPKSRLCGDAVRKTIKEKISKGLEIILKVNSNVVKVFYHLNSNCPAHKHQYDIILKDNNCFIV